MSDDRAARRASHPAQDRPSLPYLLLAGLAIFAGLYGRFKGLGFAPLSPDEYYLARSVEGILKYGLPAFDCGGYYQRGLGLQYCIALLRALGVGPELAARSVAALVSLVTLPAIYLAARRILPANLCLVVIALLALSVWEIELARFGRMYAPFQAVFCWHLVYLLRAAVDRDARALRPMLLLTLVAALIWEGGVFLALANFVPLLLGFIETQRLDRRDWINTALCGAALAITYLFATVDLRYASAFPPYPYDYSRSMANYPVSKLLQTPLDAEALRVSPLALGIFAGVLLLNASVLPFLWRARAHLVTAVGLLLVLVAALCHLLLLAAMLLAVLLLLREPTAQELFVQQWQRFWLALAASTVFWAALTLLNANWSALQALGGSLPRTIALLIFPLLAFPPLLPAVVQPFAGAAPLLCVLLFGSLSALVSWQAMARSPLRTPERIVVLLVLLLLLAVGVSNPPRSETRYVAFLYPLLVLFIVVVFARLALWRLPPQPAIAIVTLLSFALFAVAGEVSWRHIATVDSPVTTFRTQMSPARQAHLEIRDDVRDIAQWLQPRMANDDTIVVNGVHGFDNYFAQTAYFFVDEHDPNFPDWSCRLGTVDRWTNLPLISSYEKLRATEPAKRVYIVTFTPTAQQIALLAARKARVVMTRGLVYVIEMQPA